MRTSTRDKTSRRWDKYKRELAGDTEKLPAPPRTPKEWAGRQSAEQRAKRAAAGGGGKPKREGGGKAAGKRRPKRKSSLLVAQAPVPGALSPDFRPIALPVLARSTGAAPLQQQHQPPPQQHGPESGSADSSPQGRGGGRGRGGGGGGGGASPIRAKSRGRMSPHVLVSAAPPLLGDTCPDVRSMPTLSSNASPVPHAQRHSRFPALPSSSTSPGGRRSPSPERGGALRVARVTASRAARGRSTALNQILPAFAGEEGNEGDTAAAFAPTFVVPAKKATLVQHDREHGRSGGGARRTSWWHGSSRRRSLR